MLSSFGCVTRRQVNAKLWLNNMPVPEYVCNQSPELRDYGLYRRLNNGKFEFISVCSQGINDFKSMDNDSLNKFLDRLVR